MLSFTHCTLSRSFTDSPLACLPFHCLFLSTCSHSLVLLPFHRHGAFSSMFNFNLPHSYSSIVSLSQAYCASPTRPYSFYLSLPFQHRHHIHHLRLGWLLIHRDVVLNLAPKLAWNPKPLLSALTRSSPSKIRRRHRRTTVPDVISDLFSLSLVSRLL